ncbi:MAG TPA: Crp/Fnr family transcriptional regulator [bacterium]|jgi:CRP/FNR family cyclic AMP-dependent transcriptional regulator|nr:Crp/Fnr family transcriptional regulator [bacterium]
MPTLEQKLASHPLMKGLSTLDINLLAEDAIPMNFKSGEMLFRQGQKDNYLFLIFQGRVTVGVKNRGEHLPISILHAGENLGWDWLFPPYKWEFEGRALTDVETIALEGKPVAAKMSHYPLLGFTLMRHLAFSLSNALTAARRELINIHLETAKSETKIKSLSSTELMSEILAHTSGSVL